MTIEPININHLPNEMLFNTFKYLNKKDLFIVRQVSKLWRDTCDTRPLWEKIALKDFPDYQKPSHWSWKQFFFETMRSVTCGKIIQRDLSFFRACGNTILQEANCIQTGHTAGILDFISLGQESMATASIDGSVKLWKEGTLQETIHLTYMPATCLSAHQKYLAVGDEKGNLSLLEKSNERYKHVWTKRIHTDRIQSIVMNVYFKELTIFSASAKKVIATRLLKNETLEFEHEITKIAYSIKDHLLCVGTQKGLLYFYEEENKKFHFVQTLKLLHPISDLVFHQFHDRVLAAVENKILSIENDTEWKIAFSYTSPLPYKQITSLKVYPGHEVFYSNRGLQDSFNIDQYQTTKNALF